MKVYGLMMELIKEVYQKTGSFPKEEQFMLTRQIKRAIISVCSNFAEGAARRSIADRKKFYEISRSSLVEVDTQFEIAIVLLYINQKQIEVLSEYLVSVFRILSKLIDDLRN